MDPDTKLMLELAKGDISAFEQIMNKYKELVMNIAYRFLQDRSKAKDIAREVFIKVYNSAGSYKPKAKLSTWTYMEVPDNFETRFWQRVREREENKLSIQKLIRSIVRIPVPADGRRKSP